MAECPSCFIIVIAHGQQHRSRHNWPSPTITLCCPHTCNHHCGVHVDGTATYAAVKILSTAQCLEPICLPGWNQLVSPSPVANTPMESHWYPGGVVGSSSGMPPVQTDTFAFFHLQLPRERHGTVAALAERSKQEEYTALNQCHYFTPVAIKLAGPLVAETLSFLREVGCCLKRVTGEAKLFTYLQQRLSVAAQWGNASAMWGTMRGTTPPFRFLS